MMLTDYGQIKQVISTLEHEFTLSSNPNSRKGGLVGLAATAIALGRVRERERERARERERERKREREGGRERDGGERGENITCFLSFTH